MVIPNTQQTLAGRTAIVTGAGGGIGEAIARALADAGAQVIVVDADERLGQSVAESINASGGIASSFAVDATNSAAVEATVRATLKNSAAIDIIVNNVGGYRTMRKTWEIPEQEWDDIIALNLKSTFLWSKATIPGMLERSHGRIINLTSGAGKTGAGMTLSAAHYAASKAAVRGLTWHLAHELATHGITVNAIAPGPTNTARFRNVRTPDATAALIAKIPMRRLAETGNIADAAVFLASDQASYITGITLDVSGGWTMS
ncbi:MAG: SDR family oxidoreductase [Steroidobacteraceae bacterium]|nr:SDR family oxidoreductase [Steroidobacteraceae bacterium]